MSETKSISVLNKEISKELEDPNIVRGLLSTTFKDFDEKLMRQAIFEGVVRGFRFKEFLQKDVYAIKYGGGYSLVTSIGHARKIGARSGIVGKKKPVYEKDKEDSDRETCSVTVLKRFGSYVGEFTATVYTDEYDTGKNQWQSRPKTMIAKVAEMHALRMACPEEMSLIYTEEEFDKEKGEVYDTADITDDTVVVSSGDDGNDLVVPESESERKIMIFKELKRLMPDIDVTDPKEIKRVVEDLTQISFVPSQFANIIHILHRK